MIAVDGHRYRGLILAGQHELEDGHLGGGVLQGHPVRAGLDVGDARLELFVRRCLEVAVEDLFGIGQRPSQPFSHQGDENFPFSGRLLR